MTDGFIYRVFSLFCLAQAKSYRRTDIERFGWTALAFGALVQACKIEKEN